MEAFRVPGRKDDIREQVDSLYQYVTKLSKELNFMLSNIDTINLSAELAKQITIAGGKSSIFTVQPYPPYSIGDIWFGSNFIRRCTTGRESGSFNSGDWDLLIGPIVITDASQLLTNKKLVKNQATHDYGGGTSDWVLSTSEQRAETLVATNSGGAAAIIAPQSAGYRYTVVNNTSNALAIKKSGGTGVIIAAGKTASVEYIGSDYMRLTADV